MARPLCRELGALGRGCWRGCRLQGSHVGSTGTALASTLLNARGCLGVKGTGEQPLGPPPPLARHGDSSLFLRVIQATADPILAPETTLRSPSWQPRSLGQTEGQFLSSCQLHLDLGSD